LAPDAVSDRDVPVRLAVTALAGLPERGRARSDALITLGAALYRAGRFEEAVGRLNESIQANLSPRAFAFLALAHHRLGHRDEAKRWLDKLVAYQPKEGFETSPEDLEIRLLRHEVESLVAGGASPAIPSAPTKKATVDPGFAIDQGAESGPPGPEVPQ
jgi:tetratricopeptide (TPR) repeat protein